MNFSFSNPAKHPLLPSAIEGLKNYPEETLRLALERVREANALAHAPYSHFPVSALILSSGGKLASLAGGNFENASYPVGSCAEPSAISIAIAEGVIGLDMPIGVIFIYCPTVPTIVPCGKCRQAVREFSDPKETLVWCLAGETEKAEHWLFTLEQLLPLSFGPEFLPEKN